MKDGLADINGRSFDLVVIGGGMAGAGIARDAALRGYRTLLLERKDFAFGTTSRSSKLIHGGLRYLELFDVGLVRESLRERERLARLAPHLVRPLPFLVPVYRGAKRGMFMIRIGMKLYDLLTPGKRTEHYRTISRDETVRLERFLDPTDLRGSGYYFDDLLLLPERLCLENVLSAQRWGAAIYNYAEVVGITSHEPRATSHEWEIDVRGALDGSVGAGHGASVVVNAAGPWADQVRRLAGVDGGARCVTDDEGDPPAPAAHHRSRGVHRGETGRSDVLRHPLAAVHAGRHHGHRLQRRPGPSGGDSRGGALPHGGDATGVSGGSHAG